MEKDETSFNNWPHMHDFSNIYFNRIRKFRNKQFINGSICMVSCCYTNNTISLLDLIASDNAFLLHPQSNLKMLRNVKWVSHNSELVCDGTGILNSLVIFKNISFILPETKSFQSENKSVLILNKFSERRQHIKNVCEQYHRWSSNPQHEKTR